MRHGIMALGIRIPVLAGLLAASFAATAQDDMADVELEVHELSGSVAVLYGRGGNIGVSAGEDGVFLVDDQYAPLTDRIRSDVAELSDRPVKFVINTHWHGDHTGGNENLGGGRHRRRTHEHGSVHEGLRPHRAGVAQGRTAGDYVR